MLVFPLIMHQMLQPFLSVVLCVGCFLTMSSACWGQTPKAIDSTLEDGSEDGRNAADSEGEKRKYASYRDAVSSGYELRNSGKLTEARDAYEAALTFDSTVREKCEAHRSLVMLYPELGDMESMYEATEYVIEHAPYPAFSSLTVRQMIVSVYQKKAQDEFFKRYEAKLEANPKDRTVLTIMVKAVQQLLHDLPRQADYLKRLIDLDIEEGKKPDPEMRANLAFALRLSHKEVESAEIYQSISDSEKDYRSYCLAQAAESWERAGEGDKALAAAVEASNLGPDVRASQSVYDWHRLLADLFLKHLAKAPAKKHYAAALEHAPIDAYRDQCKEKLALVDALKD